MSKRRLRLDRHRTDAVTHSFAELVAEGQELRRIAQREIQAHPMLQGMPIRDTPEAAIYDATMLGTGVYRAS